MNARLRLLTTTPLLLFLGSSIAPRDEIAFGPEPGSSLTKTFETSASFDLDDFSAVIDGQNMSDMIGSFEVAVESTGTVQVTDTYDSIENGEIGKLTRTFEDLGGDSTVTIDSQMGSQEQTTSVESDLEGLTVVFTKGEDGYDVAYAEGSDGDEDLLEGLEAELDLRFLLPEGSVDEGDSWTVELGGFKQLLTPGGNLSLAPEGQDLGEMKDLVAEIQSQFSDDVQDLLDGEATCTFKGMREEDGVSLAEIQVEVEMSSAADLVDMIDQVLEMVGEEMGEDIPVSFDQADLNADAKAEGTLLWNVAAGHARSLDLSASGSFAFDLAMSVDAEGESHSGEISLEFSGSTENSVVFE